MASVQKEKEKEEHGSSEIYKSGKSLWDWVRVTKG